MRACWLKWVGRDWSISADYIWLNYSDANTLIGRLKKERATGSPRRILEILHESMRNSPL